MSMSTSVTISIPWETADQLRKEAKRRGVSVNKVAALYVKRGLKALEREEGLPPDDWEEDDDL